MFMLQITKRSKEQYLDTLAVHKYDKESSLLLLEFFSVAFSLLMNMLQNNSSLWSFAIMGKVNNLRLFLIYNLSNNIHILKKNVNRWVWLDPVAHMLKGFCLHILIPQFAA